MRRGLGIHNRRSPGVFNPLSLFQGGVQGAWYDPSDLTTLFQDSAGTTPVTAVEQPVGLMLDKSKGLVLGSELVTNGNFSNGTTGWSGGNDATISASGGELTVTAGSIGGSTNYGFVQQSITTVVGARYFIVVSAKTAAKRIATAPTGFTGYSTTTSLTYVTLQYSFIASATSTTISVFFDGTAVPGNTFTVRSVSVRTIAGNHAYQTTSASRPTLRARYNLLTYSEQFDNAAWLKQAATVSANTTTAPDGTNTADSIVEDTATSRHAVYQNSNVSALIPFIASVYVKANTRTHAVIGVGNAQYTYCIVNLSTGVVGAFVGPQSANLTASVTNQGNGWWRVRVSGVFLSADIVYLWTGASNGSETYTGDGTSGIFIWGAQLVPTAVFPTNTYQRIGADTDYATGAAFPPYLFCDGIDDGLLTNSIDFTGTDKMLVVAGVTKNSDAGLQLIAELSAVVDTNNGTMAVGTSIGGTQRWVSALRGTQLAYYEPATYAAPVTNVLATSFDIAGAGISSEIVPRVNGVVEQDNPTGANAGTGNFGNYPLYIGRRNNATAPFNGNLYSLIIAGQSYSSGQISSTESWVAAKTPLGTI